MNFVVPATGDTMNKLLVMTVFLALLAVGTYVIVQYSKYVEERETEFKMVDGLCQ